MRYTENDLILLRRFTEKGDQAAFSEIVQRYAGMVFSVCRRILGDRARAEEVSQETFFRLMTRPQSVTQSLGGWLHRAATRLAVDERRSEMSRRRREAEVAAEAQELRDDPPTQEIRWADVAPHIDEALATLPEKSKQLLIRHFLQGRQQQDLAREANVSAATISRRIKQAADELRRELRRRGLDVMPSALLMLWQHSAVEVPPAALLHGLGKMAMISGVKVVAHRSMYAAGQQALTAIQASVHARWALAALLLSAMIVAAIEIELHWGWMDGIVNRGLASHNVTPAAVVEGAASDVGPRIKIPGPADMDSQRIVYFQRMGAGRTTTITLGFADNHAVVMQPKEAEKIIIRQTGKTPSQLKLEAEEGEMSSKSQN